MALHNYSENLINHYVTTKLCLFNFSSFIELLW